MEEEQINGSIAMNLKNSFALQNYFIPEEEGLYQTDKNCAICQIVFGRVGIVHAKKYLCKFCLRGVCKKCSPEKFEHPVSKKREKICSGCVERLMESHLSEEYKLKIDNASSDKAQLLIELDYKIKENQMEKSINQYTEETIESETNLYTVKFKDLKNGINQTLESQSKIIENYQKARDEYEKFNSDIQQRNYVIETLMKNVAKLKNTYNNNKGLLPELLKKLDQLQDVSFKLKNSIKEKISIARSLTLNDKEQKLAEDIDELNHKIHVLEKEKKIYSDEIEKINEENGEFDERIKNYGKDSLIATTSQNFSLEEEARIKDLRDRSKENQKIIQLLKIRLETDKIFAKKMTQDSENVPDPGSRPCAKCIIF